MRIQLKQILPERLSRSSEKPIEKVEQRFKGLKVKSYKKMTSPDNMTSK